MNSNTYASGGANKPVSNLNFETSLRHPDVTMFKTILSSLSNVDVPLTNGWSALMGACNFGSIEKAEILLNAGGDPCFVSSPDMETPFTVAAMASKSDDDCVGYLQALLMKVPIEKREAIVNAKNRVNMTALMHAARTGKPNTCKKLLKAGARVDDVDAKGYSPLRFAVSSRNMPCCRVLMEAGANPHLQAKDRTTPLNRAESLGMPQLIDILTKIEPKPLAATVNNQPPLLGRSVSSSGGGGSSHTPVNNGLSGSRSSLHEAAATTAATTTTRISPPKLDNGMKTNIPVRVDSSLSGSSSSLNDGRTTPSASPAGYNSKVSTTEKGSVSSLPVLPAIKPLRGPRTNENIVPAVTKESSIPAVRPVSISEVLRPQQISNLPISNGHVSNNTEEKIPGIGPMTPLQKQNPPPPSVVANGSTMSGSKVLEPILERKTQIPVEKQNSLVEVNNKQEPDNKPPVSTDLVDWNRAATSQAPVSNETSANSEQNQGANDNQQVEEGCLLAGSSVVQMDELEVLLSSINLTNLLEIFRRNNITLQELLCLDEEDLKKLGIESMGARKKILEGAHLFSLTPFDKESLPSVYDRQLTCKDCVHVFSNVNSHLTSIVGSTVYARRQICRLPQLLLKTEAGPNENLDTLVSLLEEAEHCSAQLREELALLKQNVKQIKSRTEILPKYVESTKADEKSGAWKESSPSSSPLKWFLTGTLVGVGLLGGCLLYSRPDLISSLIKKLPHGK